MQCSVPLLVLCLLLSIRARPQDTSAVLLSVPGRSLVLRREWDWNASNHMCPRGVKKGLSEDLQFTKSGYPPIPLLNQEQLK